MADVARLGLTLIGAYFFGPLGALIGGLLGSLLFPLPGVKGPRLNELNIQQSTVGAPIPIVYGTYAIAGNVIWSGGLIETKHTKEVGGFLGIGGQDVTNYTYSVDVAIGICEGPITGIRRIWADADLIYDISDDETLTERWQDIFDNIAEAILGIRAASSQLEFELYLGTEDQLPDPTIQAYENVGYVTNVVPAYRGLAYIVFNDFPLEKFGNRIPNFRFEVYSGIETQEDCSSFTAGHLEPWYYMIDASTQDPRNPANQHLYKNCIESFFPPSEPFDTALASMNAGFVAADNPARWVCGEDPQKNDSDYIRGWAYSSTPNYSQPCDSDHPSAPTLLDRVSVSMNLNCIRDDAFSCRRNESGHLDFYGCAGLWIELGDWGIHAWFSAGDASGFFVLTPDNVYPTSIGVPPANWDGRGDCDPPGATPTTNKWASFDQEMCVRRWQAPLSCPGVPLAGTPGYCVVGGIVLRSVTWTRVSGLFKSLRSYEEDIGFAGLVTSYPKDPTLRSDSPFYNDQTFWEAAYADAVAANDSLSLIDPNRIPEDWVYGVDYPTQRSSHHSNLQSGIVWQASCEGPIADAECVPMAYIVGDIARRSGLRIDALEGPSQVDVSDLTTCVNGYVIGRQMSARDALMPLRMFGLWDAVESGMLLKFIERGHALKASLTSDDLGAHEHGSEAPTAVETSRMQEKDLPRRLRVHFANFEHDHEVSEQTASRITTEAINELDVEIPISMTPDTAAQLADIILYAQWVGRNNYTFALDNNRLALEPTDCIEIPVDGETVRVRIVSVEYQIGGILKCDAVRDDDGSYVSTKVAIPTTPSGGTPGGPGSALTCPSGIVILDLPRLRNVDIDAGYYVAIYGLCESWECAELWRSSDEGVTYGRVARTNDEVTVGEILDMTGPPTDPILPGDSPDYDTANFITVQLFEGTLGSVTDAQILAGANTAAIGMDGRWVIIQFKTATLDTADQWTISDIIWGLNDTAHNLGTTVAEDSFVLLSDPALLRIPEDPAAIGIPKFFKVVTCGESIDDVEAFTFTTWGLSYVSPCPSTVISATTTQPPEDPSNGDAYLLPNDTSLSGAWFDHGGEIAKWNASTNTWTYCTPVPGTIIHIIDTGNTSDTSGGGGDVIIDEDGNTTPAPWATGGATYITLNDETDTLPNSQQLSEAILDVLAAGNNIRFETVDGVTTIHVGGIPQNVQSGNYTILASDDGTHLYHPTGAAAGHTYTLDLDAAGIGAGFAITVFNLSVNSVSIAATNGTLRWIGSGIGVTGTRTLAQYGHCTIVVTELGDEALIDGTLLT
jgi:hypothetical protein